MPSAWDRSKGSLSQVVAVVDSGVNGKHPDLVGRTVAGYDAISNVDIAAGAATDEEGHGSMVAGIIAAQTDNSEGIAGVAWNAKVMPVKVMDSNGEGSDSDVIEGITWAVDHGARIVNLSLGGPDDSPALHEAVRYAVGKGAVVIVAAGNSGDGQPEYPAAYPEAIAVAATDNAGRLTDFSTHGSWVDVAAPGFGILSTQLAGDYAYGDGTSFSAPIVSGITVLLRTQTPSITPDQIASRLRSTARDAGPRGIDPYYGAGIVDATNALGGGRTTDFPQPGNGANEPNDVPARATPLTGQATGTIGTEGDVDWYRYDATETQSLSLSVTPTAYDPDVAQNLDPVISVYDQNLRLVTDDDHHGSGAAELVGFTAGPGSYYVKVENYNGAADPRSYSLSLGTHTGRLLNAPAWLEQPTPKDGATAAGDVTGDGRDDLVTIVGAYGDDTLPRGIVVHAQTSSGTLDDGTFYPTADDSPIMRFKLADVDGDGSLDVLAGTFNGLQVLYQSGDGSLAAARYLGSIQGAQAHDVAAADLDGDGDTDVVTSIYGSPSIRMRQADGTYTEAIRFRVATFDLVIGDVDGDGRPDVVGTTGSDVRVFHNDLSGWRDTVHTATLPQGSGIGGVRLVDVDRDGRTDVIALIHSSDGSSSVATYLQAADGTLAAPTSTPLPSYSETLAAADVTGDAIPDLVTSGMGENASVSVLPGLPGGGFGAPQTTSIGDTNLTARQGELATGDLDGDGRVDAAVMTRNGVAVLRNATAPTAVTSPALWARSTSPADFSTSVPMATTPTVTFAREVVPSSVTESTVALLDGHSGARVPATVTYDESAHTATVKPTSPLDENEPYRLTVSGVTDTSGAPMDAAYSSTFRTVDLVPPAVGSFTATGALGAATLTWQASTVTDLDHYVVRMAAGSTAPSSATAGTALYSGTGTGVTVPNLTQGTTYSFRIWAMDRSGTLRPALVAHAPGHRHDDVVQRHLADLRGLRDAHRQDGPSRHRHPDRRCPDPALLAQGRHHGVEPRDDADLRARPAP